MIDIQYDATIMGGREVSHPYRIWFFAEGERFLSPTLPASTTAGQWINAGGTETKNIKNSLLVMPVLRTCR